MYKKKIAYAVWAVVNYVMLALLLISLREVSASGTVFLFVLSICAYIYAFSFCWSVLLEHIQLVDAVMGGSERKDRRKFLQSIDDYTSNILEMFPYWLCLVPIYYWAIRGGILVLGWLKNGTWSDFTTCEAINSFCTFDSKFLGLNQVVLWVGRHDFGFFLSILCFGLGWLLMLREQRSN